MSLSNAIRQREEMISQYKLMLETESNTERIEDIQNQIALCQDQISQLKVGKPLFGHAKPLAQKSTLIEADPEHKGGQKVTILNPAPVITTTSPTHHNKRLGNSLRNAFKSKQTASAEESLKAKIAAAKAAKKEHNS